MTREEMKQTAKDCRIANKSTVLWDSGGTVKQTKKEDGKRPVVVRLSRGVTFVTAHQGDGRRNDCPFNPLAKKARRCICADGE